MMGCPDRARPTGFSFVLMPEFSMLALTAVVEPLRHANVVLGREAYRWAAFAESGAAVASSSGLSVNVKGDFDDIDLHSTIFICGGPSLARSASRRLLHWLKCAARHSPAIGALCTAVRVLAEARLLDGYRVAVHWELVDAFREVFPHIDVRERLFEIDRNRVTCAGEAACIDMMVTLLAAEHGDDLAVRVCERMLHARVRSPEENQRHSLKMRLGTRNPSVLRAVELMQSWIEEPLEAEQLAGQLGCSRRQVERLFRTHLNCSPMTYYRNTRLDRARGLLVNTEMNLMEVGIACGFKSWAAFSRAYRDRFGVAPAQERGIPRLTAAHGASLAKVGTNFLAA